MSDVNKAIDEQTKSAKATVDKIGSSVKTVAERTREQADKARGAFESNIVEPGKRAGAAVKAAGQKMVEGSQEVGVTIIDQAEANALQAFKALRAAAGAKDVAEVMKIQNDYLREQGDRSVAQARDVGELIARFGREVIEPLRPSDKR